MTKAYLSTGSNLGDRQARLETAQQTLHAWPGITVTRVSPIYETEPWGYLDQPLFLNQVVEIETEIPPEELLPVMKKIEKEMGRTPNFKNGPRVIDIDIILYGDWVIEREGLSIPHANIALRAFVLVPLADLIPDFVHPVLKKTIRQMEEEIDCSGIRLYEGPGVQDAG
jgi:2-amino-4-hydroxy-6-hydroxymethyldihydropteridine diphosphokinase